MVLAYRKLTFLFHSTCFKRFAYSIGKETVEFDQVLGCQNFFDLRSNSTLRNSLIASFLQPCRLARTVYCCGGGNAILLMIQVQQYATRYKPCRPHLTFLVVCI